MQLGSVSFEAGTVSLEAPNECLVGVGAERKATLSFGISPNFLKYESDELSPWNLLVLTLRAVAEGVSYTECAFSPTRRTSVWDLQEQSESILARGAIIQIEIGADHSDFHG